jgi:hypothetical protein
VTATSTTLPAGCIAGIDCPDPTCDLTPTFASVRCRLEALGTAIDGTPELSTMVGPIDRHLGQARTALDRAESRCGAAKRGPAKRNLRKMTARLRAVGKMLRSRRARHTAPAPVTAPLAGVTTRLATDAHTLTAGLACP